jgi:AAA domain
MFNSDGPRVSQPLPAGVSPLRPEQLCRRTDLASLTFATTADLAPLDGAIAQQRAIESVKFGTQIKKPGFNLFVIGPREARMGDALEALLKGSLTERKLPPDWVYVNNFEDPNKPAAIELPAGRAPDFQKAMHGLVDDLRVTIPGAFESDDYTTRRSALDEEFHKAQTDAFSTLREKAVAKGIAVLRTPLGFALAPAKNGSVVPVDEFSNWPENKRLAMQNDIAMLEKDLEQAVQSGSSASRHRRKG